VRLQYSDCKKLSRIDKCGCSNNFGATRIEVPEEVREILEETVSDIEEFVGYWCWEKINDKTDEKETFQ